MTNEKSASGADEKGRSSLPALKRARRPASRRGRPAAGTRMSVSCLSRGAQVFGNSSIMLKASFSPSVPSVCRVALDRVDARIDQHGLPGVLAAQHVGIGARQRFEKLPEDHGSPPIVRITELGAAMLARDGIRHATSLMDVHDSGAGSAHATASLPVRAQLVVSPHLAV